MVTYFEVEPPERVLRGGWAACQRHGNNMKEWWTDTKTRTTSKVHEEVGSNEKKTIQTNDTICLYNIKHDTDYITISNAKDPIKHMRTHTEILFWC